MYLQSSFLLVHLINGRCEKRQPQLIIEKGQRASKKKQIPSQI